MPDQNERTRGMGEKLSKSLLWLFNSHCHMYCLWTGSSLAKVQELITHFLLILMKRVRVITHHSFLVSLPQLLLNWQLILNEKVLIRINIM